MKKIIILTSLLSTFTAYANLNDIHFYSKKEYYDKIALEVTLEKNPELLTELADVGYSYDLAPIHVAVLDGNRGALEEIVKYKKYIDAKNMYGQTALMLALKNGRIDDAILLLENGANKDIKDIDGNDVYAYANVGGIDLDTLIKKEENLNTNNTNNTNNTINNEDTKNSKKFELIDKNINEIVEIINNNITKIDEISSNKNNYQEIISETNKEVNNIKEKLIKQSSVLLPIVKSNLDKIKMIDKQILIIDEKSNEIKTKISEIDGLIKTLAEKTREFESVNHASDKNFKNENKEEKNESMDLKNKIENSEINKEKMNLLEKDDDILIIEPLSSVIIDEDNNENVFEKIIKENLILVILTMLSLLIIPYILLKNLVKIKKNKESKDIIETIEETIDESSIKDNDFLKNIKFKEVNDKNEEELSKIFDEESDEEELLNEFDEKGNEEELSNEFDKESDKEKLSKIFDEESDEEELLKIFDEESDEEELSKIFDKESDEEDFSKIFSKEKDNDKK